MPKTSPPAPIDHPSVLDLPPSGPFEDENAAIERLNAGALLIPGGIVYFLEKNPPSAAFMRAVFKSILAGNLAAPMNAKFVSTMTVLRHKYPDLSNQGWSSESLSLPPLNAIDDLSAWLSAYTEFYIKRKNPLGGAAVNTSFSTNYRNPLRSPKADPALSAFPPEVFSDQSWLITKKTLFRCLYIMSSNRVDYDDAFFDEMTSLVCRSLPHPGAYTHLEDNLISRRLLSMMINAGRNKTLESLMDRGAVPILEDFNNMFFATPVALIEKAWKINPVQLDFENVNLHRQLAKRADGPLMSFIAGTYADSKDSKRLLNRLANRLLRFILIDQPAPSKAFHYLHRDKTALEASSEAMVYLIEQGAELDFAQVLKPDDHRLGASQSPVIIPASIDADSQANKKDVVGILPDAWDGGLMDHGVAEKKKLPATRLREYTRLASLVDAICSYPLNSTAFETMFKILIDHKQLPVDPEAKPFQALVELFIAQRPEDLVGLQPFFRRLSNTLLSAGADIQKEMLCWNADEIENSKKAVFIQELLEEVSLKVIAREVNAGDALLRQPSKRPGRKT